MSVTIDAFAMPTLQVGVAASVTLSASGGSAPYQWSLAAQGGASSAQNDSATNTASAGRLPAGLILSAAGVLSGVPVASGQFRFVLSVIDLLGAVGFMEVSGTVLRPANSRYADATIPMDEGGQTWCRVKVAMKQPGIPQSGRLTSGVIGQEIAYQGGDTVWVPRSQVRTLLEERVIAIIPGAGGTGDYGNMQDGA
jgi:hypothetical protein